LIDFRLTIKFRAFGRDWGWLDERFSFNLMDWLAKTERIPSFVRAHLSLVLGNVNPAVLFEQRGVKLEIV
jgi:hypothetical protein